MSYHDNEYKPDSPKKTTENKEELIALPEYHARIYSDATILPQKSLGLSHKRSTFLNKNLVGGGNICSNPCAVFGGSNHGAYLQDPNDPSGTNVQIASQQDITNMWQSHGYGLGSTPPSIPAVGGTTARWRHKVYYSGSQTIAEFWIDPVNCTMHLEKVWSGPSGVAGPGACSIDEDTMLISGSRVDRIFLDPNSNPPTFTRQTIINLPPNSQTGGDIIYRPLDDTVAIVGHGPDAAGTLGVSTVWHYDMQGNQLDIMADSLINECCTLFCHDGNIYTSDRLIGINPLTHQWSGLNLVGSSLVGDGATSPCCCDSTVSSSYCANELFCYNIGDTGPENGIIFAVPNFGANTTNYYYEVAKNDVATGGVPTDCFNLTCGDEKTTYIVTNGTATHQQMDEGKFIFFWNGMAAAWPTPGSDPPPAVGDVITAITPNLFADLSGNPIPATTISSITPDPITNPTAFQWVNGLGPLTIEIADQFGSGMALNSTSQYTLPFQLNITSVVPASVTCGIISDLGTEWGAYNQPWSAIQTLPDFGLGIDNTGIIASFPSTNTPCPSIPYNHCHPWLDTRDIAASECMQYGTSNDWFLPSYREFLEMVTQVGSLGTGQIILNNDLGNSEHIYWTSTQSNMTDDKYSIAWDAVTNNHVDAFRCHPLSVRPIRRFECEVCIGCDCLEYNYRDGVCGQLVGSVCSQLNSSAINPIDWNTTVNGTLPGSAPTLGGTIYDSTIGGDLLRLTLSATDVSGNTYSNSNFSSGSGEYFISLWDQSYHFMGKWKYDFDSITNLTTHQIDTGEIIKEIELKNGIHVEGDYPVLWYDDPNAHSATGIYFKIEWDGANSYETGCNSSVFGNPHPFNSFNSAEDWPAYCGPIFDSVTGIYTGVYSGIPRYATFQPDDLNGAPIPVLPNIWGALPTLPPTYSWVGATSYYPNTTTQQHGCTCFYNIGDTGPAGGIIVATPNMGMGTVTPNGADENPSEYYYELSPTDLEASPISTNPAIIFAAQWGHSYVELSSYTTPASPPNWNYINQTDIFPGIGQSLPQINHHGMDNLRDMLYQPAGSTGNYPNIQTIGNIGPYPSAFVMCRNYSLNGYNDWFLPTVREWFFVRNNIPPISNIPIPPFSGSTVAPITHPSNLYWTSNYWDADDNVQFGAPPPAASLINNINYLPFQNKGTPHLSGAPIFGAIASTPAVLGGVMTSTDPYHLAWWGEKALALTADAASTVTIDPGTNSFDTDVSVATEWTRMWPAKVRAMRKFFCETPPGYDSTHQFSICGVRIGRTWYAVPSSYHVPRPIAMENNPLNVTLPPFYHAIFNPGGNIVVLGDYDAFRNWLTDAGTNPQPLAGLIVGDTFQFEQPGYTMQMTYIDPQTGNLVIDAVVDEICFKYHGILSIFGVGASHFFNQGAPLPVVFDSNCCISGGSSSSSITRPTNESNPNSIKMSFEEPKISKREKHKSKRNNI